MMFCSWGLKEMEYAAESELVQVKEAVFRKCALPDCARSRIKLASNCGAAKNPPRGPDMACKAAEPPLEMLND